ncbi:hypothetical protein pb186bvf_008647 [Paramecium bursaria]
MDQWQLKLKALQQNVQEVQNEKQDVAQTLQKVKLRMNKHILIKDEKEHFSKENKENYNIPQDIQEINIQDQSKDTSFIHINNETRLSQEFQKPECSIQMRPIAQFLGSIRLVKYLQNFLDLGVYENGTLLKMLPSENQMKFLLQRFGIDKVGYQRRILAQLEEDQGLFIRKGVLSKLDQVKDELPNLEDWLESINMKQLQGNFEVAGYDQLEMIVFIQQSSFALTISDLIKDLNIQDKQEAALIYAYLTIMCDKMIKYEMKGFLNKKKQSGLVQCSLPLQNQCQIF